MKSKNILEKFNKLQESYNPVNAALYNEYIKSLSVKEVMENSEFIFIEPIFGAKTFLNILKENIDT
ncbi:hypothetical protein, partial [Brevibacillus sp. MCWH]|uniref:hypothetical protein n=1 Tax=Brevibacillus sp. MCWH TaxID=2508871 RepID=UPI001C0F0B71